MISNFGEATVADQAYNNDLAAGDHVGRSA
jgi:hypothetical protein